MLRLLICLFVALAVGCNLFGESPRPGTSTGELPDAGVNRDASHSDDAAPTANDAGADSGSPESDACTPETDDVLCDEAGVQCGELETHDLCGVERTVDCGGCSAPEQCGGGGSDNVCGCPLESDTVFCDRIGAPCGNVTATDSCNTERTTYCGTCGAGQMCENNTCVCEPETAAVFCERVLGCGELTALDNCGDFRTIDCQRECPDGESCVNEQCTCQPELTVDFCARHSATCGVVDAQDNCGARTENCGTCTADANVCWENRCNTFPSNGLVLNVAAALGVTETVASRVSQWTDQVSGRTFSAWGGDRPERVVGHSGHRALRFSGDQELETNNALNLSQSFTMSLVIQRRPTSRRGTFLSGDGFTGSSFSFGNTPERLHIEGGYGQGQTFTVLSTEQLDVLTIRVRPSTVEIYQGHQETASTSLSPIFGGTEIAYIGTSEFNDTALHGDIYEILIWSRALSEAEISVVVAELHDRYDLSP